MSEYKFRKSYMIMIVGALFFGACGAVIFTMDFESGDIGRRAAFFAAIPFGKEILLAFCAGCVGFYLWALLSGKPSHTAGHQGLVFTSLFGKVFPIRWEDIEAVTVSQQYLTLHHVREGKVVKANIGGLMKMKPQQILDKLNEISGGRLGGR